MLCRYFYYVLKAKICFFWEKKYFLHCSNSINLYQVVNYTIK